jgi:hypothetical protein
MDCDRFEQAWQRHFDGESADPPSNLARWDDHLVVCSICQAVDRRYRALGMALSQWSSAESALVNGRGRPRATHAVRTRGASRHWPGVAASGLAIAASLALFVLIPAARIDPGVPVQPRQAPQTPVIASLASPFLGATSATARLARVATLPAALIGREVLASAAYEPAPPAADLEAARAGLRELGGRVYANFQPLTIRARGAFDFVVPGASAGHEGREPVDRGA